jgi:hypothetical protein
MDMLIGERQRVGFKSTNELSAFHLNFLAITNWLIEKKQLSDLEQKRSYLLAFPQSLLALIHNRLQMKFPAQHPNIPHDVKDVYEAARYMLQSQSLTSSYLAPASLAPPVTILQRPAAPITGPITQSPTVKTEDMGALFSELTKTLVEAMSQTLRGAATSNNSSGHAHQGTKGCHFCGDEGHFIPNCDKVTEFATAGKCKRNQEGKVVLPSGSFVPRDIPGKWLMDRVNEYHRRFPNQLAAIALMHTIARAPTPVLASSLSRNTYQLSASDRIANLEAELFNLRARKQPPASHMRTRAQARDQPEEPVEEIVAPAVRQATPNAAPEVPRITITEPTVPRETAPRIIEEPEHGYQNAKDAAYAPPVNRNVGAPVKPAAPKKADPAYKTLPPIHEASIAVDIYK